jgi:hypothetical protein
MGAGGGQEKGSGGGAGKAAQGFAHAREISNKPLVIN